MKGGGTGMYYHSFNEEMHARFGRKMYKLSLDSGMTCPNRDGTLGDRGCIFCSGAGEFAESGEGGIDAQIARAKAQVASKAKDAGYIAYFQSFTNTYAPPERLRELYLPIAARPDIAAVDIATRPDCLGEAVLEVLTEVNWIKPVWVELGLQTIHPDTAALIRRGYDLPCFDRAVSDLRARGLDVIVHQILGLPGENRERMLATTDYIARAGVQGIKFHLLHVLASTDLAALYDRGEVDVLTMEAYIDLLAECVEHLPREMTVHRLTGDGDKRTLIAPAWSADKKRVLNAIRAEFARRDVEQGRQFPG